MTDIIDRLKEPEVHYPGNFDTPKRANAMLSCLCQEAAEEIESLRRQLKHMTDQYNAALEAEQVRYRQVVDKDAEIERLKGMVDEIQAAHHMHREHNRLLTNLASSQAREQHVMCVVEQVALALDAYFSYERGLDQYIEELNGLYKESQDTTALEAMIAKAGEVMRERCLSEFWHEMSQSEVEVFIRALPAVTIDDLKGGA